MRPVKVELHLPGWVEEFFSEKDEVYPTAEERMTLAVDLARHNVRNGTGGPFGAAIFERESGSLISSGVNLVVPENCSAAHAEMVAVMLAQQSLGSYDLNAAGMPEYELVTSAEPCAMCLGAVPWSGVRSLVCGARSEDAEEIGFDEGDKPENWVEALQRRGISVRRDVLREGAAGVLQEYARIGGEIYNSRKG
jgi:tRNA(Arg) A34 adenosine deaminase TadA